MDSKAIAIVAFVLAIILATVSHGAPFWAIVTDTFTDGTVDWYFGLWQFCAKYQDRSLECDGLDENINASSLYTFIKLKENTHTVRYLDIITPFLLIVSIVAVLIGSTHRVVVISSSVLSGATGCLLIGANVAYVTTVLEWIPLHQIVPSKQTLHFCFYGSNTAAILSFVACGALIKHVIQLAATVSPFQGRHHNTEWPRHTASSVQTGTRTRHTHHVPSAADNHRFATATRQTAGRNISSTMYPGRNMHSQGHSSHEGTLLSHDYQQATTNATAPSAHNPTISHFQEHGLHHHGISRRSRDSWLSEVTDMSPTPPGSRPSSAISYIFGRSNTRIKRNLNF